MKSWRPAVAIVATIVAGGMVACGGADGPAHEAAGIPSVSGVVLDVTAKSLIQIDMLTVQDDTGVTWKFRGGTYRGISPSHMREHMLQGVRITVWYLEENGLLDIARVGDYVPEGAPELHRWRGLGVQLNAPTHAERAVAPVRERK